MTASCGRYPCVSDEKKKKKFIQPILYLPRRKSQQIEPSHRRQNYYRKDISDNRSSVLKNCPEVGRNDSLSLFFVFSSHVKCRGPRPACPCPSLTWDRVKLLESRFQRFFFFFFLICFLFFLFLFNDFAFEGYSVVPSMFLCRSRVG